MENGTLHPLDKDIWVVNHDFFNLGIHFPGRMTVVRLASGGLWLHSPGPIDDALAASLAALGPVEVIVAPNKFHHMFVGPALERFPDAKVYGAPGLSAKRKDIDFEAELSSEALPSWADDLLQLSLRAIPFMAEVVFFHRKSGTLITTDLFMNVHDVQGYLGWFIYWVEGCWKRADIPRLNKFMVKDKDQMRSEGAIITNWPIQRLIMAHGEIVEDSAAEVVRKSYSVFGPLRDSAAVEV